MHDHAPEAGLVEPLPVAFERAVAEIATPYLRARGFQVTGADPDAVRFASARVLVVVAREERSFEIYLRFGLASAAPEQFEIASAIVLSDEAVAAAYRDFAATTPAAVRRGVTQLVDLKDRYCRPALRGDPSFYAAMREWANDHPPRWLQAQEREIFERQARAAMDQRDWSRIVSLYASAPHTLSRLDRKRVEIAQRHLRPERPSP